VQHWYFLSRLFGQMHRVQDVHHARDGYCDLSEVNEILSVPLHRFRCVCPALVCARFDGYRHGQDVPHVGDVFLSPAMMQVLAWLRCSQVLHQTGF
jgi:hypothetical protein